MSAGHVKTHWLPDCSGTTAAFVASRTWGHYDDYHYAWGCFTEDGRLIGGFVIYDVTQINCYGAVALDPGAVPTRALIREIHNFMFNILGVRRQTILQKPSNERARKFVTALGYQPEGIIRQGHPDGDDLNVYGLLKHECKFVSTREKGHDNGRQGTSTES